MDGKLKDTSSLKRARFKEMEQVRKHIKKEIDVLANILKKYYLFSDGRLEKYTLGYLHYRLKKKPIRAYACWRWYTYLHSYQTQKPAIQDDFVTTDPTSLYSCKLALVFELIITIQYLDNHTLDEKYESKVGNHPKVSKNLLVSNILRELLFLYTEQEIAPLIASDKFLYLQRQVRQLLLRVDIGQRIDKQYNTYHYWTNPLPEFAKDRLFLGDAHIKKLISPTIEEISDTLKYGETFTHIYFHRIYLTNVYFFQSIAEIVAELSEAEPAPTTQLVDHAVLYGFMLQLINDYADFAYTDDQEEKQKLKVAGKKTTDFFSDLYNLNVTLPLIFHLQNHARRKIETYLAGNSRQRKALRRYARQIKQEIVSSGAIWKCVYVSRELSKTAVSHLDLENPASPYLENMCEIAFDNKFYQAFNKER